MSKVAVLLLLASCGVNQPGIIPGLYVGTLVFEQSSLIGVDPIIGEVYPAAVEVWGIEGKSIIVMPNGLKIHEVGTVDGATLFERSHDCWGPWRMVLSARQGDGLTVTGDFLRQCLDEPIQTQHFVFELKEARRE